MAKAQQLFLARGYDAVSVAEVTETLGINPPSLYAAFGSKAGLYARILERWASKGAIPLHEILRPDRSVADSLAAVLEEAARRYAANPDAAGCLVIEGTRCNDPEAREAAKAINRDGERLNHDYIADRHPQQAVQVADFVSTTLSGLSAKARDGYGLDQLLVTARIASQAVGLALSA